jgi:glutathione S-transferase
MITLYTFGPAFGLPDPSPFVLKAEVLLKMSGLAYRTDDTGFRKAPKGKLPYIDDDGERIADSTFIRWHLEQKHQIEFDRGLTSEQRAIAWAFEKMAEDHLYWAFLDVRWNDDANFAKGPARFFRQVPAPLRPLVMAMIRRQIRNRLHAHGMGRHSKAEIVALGTRSIDAIADFLAASHSSWDRSRPRSTRRSSLLPPEESARYSNPRCKPRPNGMTICVAMSGG